MAESPSRKVVTKMVAEQTFGASNFKKQCYQDSLGEERLACNCCRGEGFPERRPFQLDLELLALHFLPLHIVE